MLVGCVSEEFEVAKRRCLLDGQLPPEERENVFATEDYEDCLAICMSGGSFECL